MYLLSYCNCSKVFKSSLFHLKLIFLETWHYYSQNNLYSVHLNWTPTGPVACGSSVAAERGPWKAPPEAQGLNRFSFAAPLAGIAAEARFSPIATASTSQALVRSKSGRCAAQRASRSDSSEASATPTGRFAPTSPSRYGARRAARIFWRRSSGGVCSP